MWSIIAGLGTGETFTFAKRPLHTRCRVMVRTFLKVYMELGSYFLFLQAQIKDIIIMETFQYNLV